MTPGRGIFFGKTNSKEIVIYTDAEHGRDPENRRSSGGYFTFVWGNLIIWRSKKQSVVSRSSAEAELRAVANGVCEGMWITRVLQELRISTQFPIKMWCDSMAAIQMINNPIHHDRTKHVKIDRHFIKEKIESKIINLSHIRSSVQVADILTKPLDRGKFEFFRGKLGMLDIYSLA